MTTRTTIGTVTFITNGESYYAINETIDGKAKTKPVSRDVYEARLAAAQAAVPGAPAEAKADPAPDAPQNPAPAEPKGDTPKAKTHPTADAFLAKMPAGTYIFKRNNKGHIRIFKAEDSKTAYAKLVAKKDGVNICPSKELREAKPDVAWVYHEGWACKYAYKAADWDEVATVLGF